MIVGGIVAGATDWSDPCIAGLRGGAEDAACSGTKALARALARLDSIVGWTAENLVAAMLDSDAEGQSSFAGYVTEWMAAQDPFDPAPVRAATSDEEVALDFLLRSQGRAPRLLAEGLVQAGREAAAPRAAALAALTLGRHLLPRSMRPAAMDDVLSDQELRAAGQAVLPRRGTRPKKQISASIWVSRRS
jgi:hypothetical protein